MVESVVVLSGQIAAGKSSLAKDLAQRFGYRIFKTIDVLKSLSAKGLGSRADLQAFGDRQDRSTNGDWVRDRLLRWIEAGDAPRRIVVDAVRILPQVDAIRRGWGARVVHIHLTAPDATLSNRYDDRRRERSGEFRDYAAAKENKTERLVGRLSVDADVVIDTARCTKGDVLVRAAAYLKLFGKDSESLVDVLIGGGYGSEGKGQIAAHISREYSLLVRGGGPNAGHRVFQEPEPYTHHQLPSGTRTSNARLLIAPGAVLNVVNLLGEIADCQVEPTRLAIDPQAMTISPKDRIHEMSIVTAIASTGQGVGRATARRITRRGRKSTRLAKDIPVLKPYIREAAQVLEDSYARGARVLLEGTQGTGLSIYHGAYPHVTSRDTTASGLLSEVGVAPKRVRRVVMVCRTYPIRVGRADGGESSGPMSQELTFEEVSRRSGLDLEELRKHERTSTTNRPRRIAEFDWSLLRRAAQLNGPTDIALTFADYLSVENRRARRFEQLDADTIRFVEEVERIASCPVSLISTRFHSRSIIDRRAW